MPAVIERLSEGDLRRYRRISARHTLAENGHPGLGLQEAEDAIVAYYELLGELLERYEIDEDALVNISLEDGTIMEKE